MFQDTTLLEEVDLLGRIAIVPVKPEEEDVKLTDTKRVALCRTILHNQDLTPKQKDIQLTFWLECNNHCILQMSIREWCAMWNLTNRRRTRALRDELYNFGFKDVDAPGRTRALKSTISEEEITDAIKALKATKKGASSGPLTSTSTQGRIRPPQAPTQGHIRPPSVFNGGHNRPHSMVQWVPQRPPQDFNGATGGPHLNGEGHIRPPSENAPYACERAISNNNLPISRSTSLLSAKEEISPPRTCASAREAWVKYWLEEGELHISDDERDLWHKRGLDDAQIDLLLIEADGKLYAHDRKTQVGVTRKVAMFFAKAARDKLERDNRYSQACKRNKQDDPKAVAKRKSKADRERLIQEARAKGGKS